MELLEVAVAAARAAGEELRARFAQPRTGVGTKSSPTDLVTDADRAGEALIVDRIRTARPDDGLLGEETGERAGSTGLRWVIDPLDGTTNFVYGIPRWSVSIACEDGEGPLAGVVYDPLASELFAAARGEGATLNGDPIEPTGATDLGRALVATGFSYRPEERAAEASILTAILPRVRDIRRAGAASLDLAWVACGRVDGYFEVPIKWWDVAAGVLLVREAGGAAGEVAWVRDGEIGFVAAGRGIYEELRALVTGAVSRADASPH